MVRRTVVPAGILALGVVTAAALTRDGAPVQAALWLVLLAVVAWATSPWFFPRSTTLAVARERSLADGRPVVLWRPGCTFCLRLRMSLGTAAGRAHWVDIWADPAGAAAVRDVTGGDETVPTVLATDEARVNPDPSWVRALLR